ncbi:DUF1003 domain-containing protein [Sphingobacterium daejeonense]|uniref:DUF1003 domain-containing protein n=1 Tax=Sphingobacterium daejeonense TaxID=371142 RepID=UPI0010C3EFDB|nr:DUF1003 domain-containing protein [Sphingobacterium daejeonense]VTP98120.1 Uncharacterised protein [Sphingobacterium daejeonense]
MEKLDNPYPFILMNLVLSCIKTELEIRSLLKKIDMLLQEEIKQLFESQVTHLKLLKQMSDHIDKLEKEIKNRYQQ